MAFSGLVTLSTGLAVLVIVLTILTIALTILVLATTLPTIITTITTIITTITTLRKRIRRQERQNELLAEPLHLLHVDADSDGLEGLQRVLRVVLVRQHTRLGIKVEVIVVVAIELVLLPSHASSTAT